MANVEDSQHDILLIIIIALIILFATGIAVPPETPITPIIIPPG